LYVNKVTPQVNETNRSVVTIDLASKEFIVNENVRLNIRFDGKYQIILKLFLHLLIIWEQKKN
jgi:hypothetical protein